MKSDARALFYLWAYRELGYGQRELAKRLGMTQPGVGYAVKKGKAISKSNNYQIRKQNWLFIMASFSGGATKKGIHPQNDGAGAVKAHERIAFDTEDNHPQIEQDNEDGRDRIVEGPVRACQGKSLCAQDHHADHREHGEERQGHADIHGPSQKRR